MMLTTHRNNLQGSATNTYKSDVLDCIRFLRAYCITRALFPILK